MLIKLVLNQRVLNVKPQKVVRRWKLDAGAASRRSRHAQPPLAQCGAALISVRCVSIAPFRLAVRRDAVDEERARYVRRGGRDERVQAEDVLREHGHRLGEPRGQAPVGAIVKLNKSACNARILRVTGPKLINSAGLRSCSPSASTRPRRCRS